MPSHDGIGATMRPFRVCDREVGRPPVNPRTRCFYNVSRGGGYVIHSLRQLHTGSDGQLDLDVRCQRGRAKGMAATTSLRELVLSAC